MKNFLAVALAVAAGVQVHAQLAYPATRTVDASDTYFGKTYADPYRWLENLQDKEVAAWFKAQATLTDDLLAKIPAREALVKEWTELDKLRPARYGDISFENGRVFYKKTLGGENVGKLFYRDGWTGAEKPLFDPTPYKAGVQTTINSFAPSVDGRLVARADAPPGNTVMYGVIYPGPGIIGLSTYDLMVIHSVTIKEIDAGAYIAASVVLVGDRAYFGQYENEFLCVDLKSGAVAWRYRDLDFPYLAAAALTPDRVVFGGFDKTMHCLQRSDGTNLWKFPTRGKIESSPVVAGGRVVFGSDDGSIYMLALADGKKLWSYDVGQPVASSPAVAAEKIVMGCDDGNVYCFGQKSN